MKPRTPTSGWPSNKDTHPSFTPDWSDIGEHRLYLRRWTSPDPTAPTVVIVHGIVSGRYLVPTAKALARTHTVLAPDLPGFGESSRPDARLSIEEQADVVADLIGSTGVKKATFVGHSIGAQVVASLASRHADAVERLVLVGPTGDPRAPSAPAVVARWLANAPIEPVGFNALACRELVDVGVRRMVATLRAALTDPFLDNLCRLAVPTLVVRGERDRVSPQRWVEEITSALRHGRLVVIPAHAHTLVYSAPAELAKVLGKDC